MDYGKIKLEKGSFRSTDGQTRLETRFWLPEGEPQCIVQLVHGMCEHIDRYNDYAEYLASKGIAVIGHNQLGHGVTDCQGYFASKDGLALLVGDVYRVNRLANSRFPNLPIVLLGHSMGSFVTRKYITVHPGTVDAYVSMGTGAYDKRSPMGLAVIKLVRLLRGEKYRSKLLYNLSLGAYAKRIPGCPHRNCWLTHNESQWYAYEEDPMCGFVFTAVGYEDVVKMSVEVNSAKCFRHTPKELPILIISGTEDPVGDMGIGAARVYRDYRSYDCNAEIALLYGVRHEVLNDGNIPKNYERIDKFLKDNHLIDYGVGSAAAFRHKITVKAEPIQVEEPAEEEPELKPVGDYEQPVLEPSEISYDMLSIQEIQFEEIAPFGKESKE